MSKLQPLTPAQIAQATKHKLLGETSCESCQFCYVEIVSATERVPDGTVRNLLAFNMFCALNSNPCTDRFSGARIAFRYDNHERVRIADTPALHHRCPRYLERTRSPRVPVYGVHGDPAVGLEPEAEQAIKEHRKRRRNHHANQS